MATKSGNYWTCDGKVESRSTPPSALKACDNAVFIERTVPNPIPDGWITVELHSTMDNTSVVKTYCCKSCLLSDNQ